MKKIMLTFGLVFIFSLTMLWANTSEQGNDDGVSFYKVPLVCNAAPDIGCGSRAKPILKEFAKQKGVKEAWLNREGTVIAVVWQTDVKESTASKVFSKFNLNGSEVSSSQKAELMADFGKEGAWLKGTDVDQLSIEEAGIISEGIITALKKGNILPSDKEAGLRSDLVTYFKKELLSITDAKQLNPKTYERWAKEAHAIGENHLGKGKMPEIDMNCDSNKCNIKDRKSKKSCCSKS